MTPTLHDYLGKRHAVSVLDLACGAGSFAKLLADSLASVTQVIGVDIRADSESGFLETLGDQPATFRNCGVEDVLREPAQYDVVGLSYSLHHIGDIESFLGLLGRIVAPGGLCVTREMYSDGLTPAQDSQKKIHEFAAEMDRHRGDYHAPVYPRSEIDRLVSLVGLPVVARIEEDTADTVITDPEQISSLVERVSIIVSRTYPDSVPPAVAAERDQVIACARETGISPPPALIHVLGNE